MAARGGAVNWAHIQTYAWVRWRLSVNQVKRSGAIGVVIAALLNGLMLFGGILTFILGLIAGILALKQAGPRTIMGVWDGAAFGFLVFWFVGLVSELQRTELLSLDNFMHLPVSPSGAFLINYLGASLGLSIILFFPAMTGLALGMVLSRGPGMFLLIPLVVAFFLMVTAVTYQFRGWLARMISNPRRRRTIIAVASLLLILIFQIPNILTNLNPEFRERRKAGRESREEFSALMEDLSAGRITQEEYNAQFAEKQAAYAAGRKRESDKVFGIIRLANGVIPPGWLPYGAESMARGRPLPAAVCMFGMALIGVISLRRAYRTTINLYMGNFNKGRVRRKTETKSLSGVARKSETVPAASFVEKKIPRISETASATALAGFRSLLRAPEVKMMMLTPAIMLVVFGSMILSNRGDVPALIRPLVALGLSSFILIISLTGFIGNQFAFDRSGFRAFVLCGASRREILLGKNLSLLPFAVTLMVCIAGISQWLYPMRLDYLAAVLVQFVPVYLLICMAGNVVSILSPMTLRQGSGKPASHQGIGVLYHLAFMLVVPMLLACTLIPFAIEALVSSTGVSYGIPFFLVLNIVQAAASVWIYRRVLDRQAELLQRREQKILEVVSAKGE